MLLSALLFAAAYSAGPPLIVNPPPARRFESIEGWTAAPTVKTIRPLFAKPPAGRVETTRAYAWKTETPAIPSAPTWCRESGLQRAHDAEAPVLARVVPLGDLPQANHTLAVLRKVDGCPVSSTVRFNVGR